MDAITNQLVSGTQMQAQPMMQSNMNAAQPQYSQPAGGLTQASGMPQYTGMTGGSPANTSPMAQQMGVMGQPMGGQQGIPQAYSDFLGQQGMGGRQAMQQLQQQPPLTQQQQAQQDAEFLQLQQQFQQQQPMTQPPVGGQQGYSPETIQKLLQMGGQQELTPTFMQQAQQMEQALMQRYQQLQGMGGQQPIRPQTSYNAAQANAPAINAYMAQVRLLRDQMMSARPGSPAFNQAQQALGTLNRNWQTAHGNPQQQRPVFHVNQPPAPPMMPNGINSAFSIPGKTIPIR